MILLPVGTSRPSRTVYPTAHVTRFRLARDAPRDARYSHCANEFGGKALAKVFLRSSDPPRTVSAAVSRGSAAASNQPPIRYRAANRARRPQKQQPWRRRACNHAHSLFFLPSYFLSFFLFTLATASEASTHLFPPRVTQLEESAARRTRAAPEARLRRAASRALKIFASVGQQQHPGPDADDAPLPLLPAVQEDPRCLATAAVPAVARPSLLGVSARRISPAGAASVSARTYSTCIGHSWTVVNLREP